MNPGGDARWTKATTDGLGRTVVSEAGHGGTTESVVDTVYGACGCTPMGKMKQVSLPHAPGGTVYWTTYTYDALGRTLSVALPNGMGTTNYEYVGNTVKVTDAAGKWKRFTLNVDQTLVAVEEPDPAGGANLLSVYGYNFSGQLASVLMPRGGAYQTRSFLYDSAGRPYQSSNPETGTTTTAYNQNGTVASVTDAKGQIKKFDYDSYNRVTAVHRWTDYSTEDLKQKVEYSYDSNPYEGDMGAYLAGRLAAVHYWSLRGKSYFSTDYAEVIESYGYSQAGAVTKKRMRVKARWAADHNSPYVEQAMDVSYAYDNQGRRTQMVYPPAVSGGGSLRTLNYTYDSMGRPYSMTEAGGPNWVPSMTYNLTGQVTSGPHGAYQYNILGQMTRQTYTSGTVVFDEQYQFSATNNNGKMLSKQNFVTGEDVQYTYDALQRLASAQTVQTPTTAAPQWGDSYTYDGYGNLTDMTPIGTGLNLHVSYAALTNRQNGVAYDANGNDVGANTNPTTRVYDVDNRLSVSYAGGAGYGTEYGYAPDNKRILKSESWDGFVAYDTRLYFHGVGGERLGEYRFTFQNSGASLSLDLVAGNTWFGGKLLREGDWAVVQDAKGSVRWRKNALTSAVETADYYPYGQEKPGATADNRQKFGTYLRDSETGLDYADQRYFSSTVGRFMTADPYKASGGPGDPGSWNRYSYTRGDPANRKDRSGLCDEDTSTSVNVCDPAPTGPAAGTQPPGYDPAIDVCTVSIMNGYGPAPGCPGFDSGVTATGPPEYNGAGYQNALDAFEVFKNIDWSKKCSDFLFDTLQLTGADIFSKAQELHIEDGQLVDIDYASALFPNDPNLATNNWNGLTVAQAFFNSPSIAAASAYRGNTIYVNTGFAGGAMGVYTLLHESLHSWGFDDAYIQGAFGIEIATKEKPGTANITQKLLEKCGGG